MHFPPWIDRERNPLKRAQRRLKFMLAHAALRHYGRTSMHDLARDAGVNHSSIFNAINRGYFTEPMAEAIEKVFGANELPRQHLIKPLEVNREPEVANV
jgi:lambda repressor-like predicted transcriptional regulator